MINVFKMVKLDFSLIKPYMKTMLVVLIAPVIIMYSTQDVVSSLVLCMSIMAMTSNYTFSIAEKNDLNRLYGLIPVSKKDIVMGRYMFTALTGIAAVIVGVIINTIILTTAKKDIPIDEMLIAVSVSFFMYILFTAIELPGLFKLGAIKGRFISFIPFIGMFLVGVVAQRVSPESLEKLPDLAVLNNNYALFACFILLDIIIYGISIGISQRIYDKMEL